MANKDSKAEKPTEADHPAANGKDLQPLMGMPAMQTWAQIGVETVRFVVERQQENVKTLHALRSCTSLAEIRDLQVQAFKTAQDQYARQTRRMMDMAVGAATAGLIPDASSKPRGYDDVPI